MLGGQGTTLSGVERRRLVRDFQAGVCYTPPMKSLAGLIGYVCIVALFSVPSWLALRYSDVDFAFVSVMAIIVTFQMSIAFVLSAQNSKTKKYKEIDII